MNDAIADRIDGGFGDVKTLLPHIETKAITPLAVTVSERAPQLPDIPTVGEIGLPEVQTENWFGLMALARTPPAILERLKAAVVAAQSDPAYRAALGKLGAMSGKPGPTELSGVIAPSATRSIDPCRLIGGAKRLAPADYRKVPLSGMITFTIAVLPARIDSSAPMSAPFRSPGSATSAA